MGQFRGMIVTIFVSNYNIIIHYLLLLLWHSYKCIVLYIFIETFKQRYTTLDHGIP